MQKPLHSFLLPQGNSPREDFLFDEEKNSWQHSRTAMSFLFVKEEILTREKSSWECGGEGWRAMSFSLRQRGKPHEEKSLWEREGEMEVTRENISTWCSIEVSLRFYSSSMRKSSYSFHLPPPLPQGNPPREDFLFDEEKNSQQLPRTAMSFSLRQRGNPHKENFLVERGRNVRVSTLIKKKTIWKLQ